MTKLFTVLLVGLFGWSNACLASGGCSVRDPTDIEYLIFWGPWPGEAPDPLDRIGPLAAKVGTTGDGKTRQLGFGPGIPFWVRDEFEHQGGDKAGFRHGAPNKCRGSFSR